MSDLKHVAIIMDGNRRYSKKLRVSIKEGYRLGAENTISIIKKAIKSDIRYLTLYTFSSDNWKRSKKEIQIIMKIIKDNLNKALRDSNLGCKIRFIGNLAKLPDDIQSLAREVQNLSQDETNSLEVIIALNYSGRTEIVKATKDILEYMTNNKLHTETIDESLFSNFLYTNSIPNPDLCIRTGGEKRLSNFLLWQLAYTELYFSKKYWPEFTWQDLKRAILCYQKRGRRYGA